MVLAAMVVCAMAAWTSSSVALTPSRYVLRHPKREHCKVHYKKKVVIVKKRFQGHTKKVRETVCVRVDHLPPKQSLTAPSPQPPTQVPIFIFVPTENAIQPPAPAHTPRRGPEPRGEEPGTRERKREPPAATCTTIFTGAEGASWGTAANWTAGIPNGFSSFGCIPPEYPSSAIFSTTSEMPTEIGGVSAQNAEGITLQSGHLTLANPQQKSIITNVRPGGATVTLAEGVILQLVGGCMTLTCFTSGELGGGTWNGPGTLEVPERALLRIGNCTSWNGQFRTICADGTPTPAGEGLQIKNFGTMYGAGISLCRGAAAQPAKLENEGVIHIRNSGSFGGGPECGEVGAVINRPHGRIGLAQLDGNGCNVHIGIGSFQNEGELYLGTCIKPETEELHRAELEIGSSLIEAGTVTDYGIIHIQGDYTPTPSSKLTIGVAETPKLKKESNTTDFGTIRVSGNATLAGELSVGTLLYAPSLGQKVQILEVGGSLSGEFVLGGRCIPAEPGNGWKPSYKIGTKGSVTLEVVKLTGC